MRLHFPVDVAGNLIMIEKLVLGDIWTGDLPIFNPDALTWAEGHEDRGTMAGAGTGARARPEVAAAACCDGSTASANEIPIVLSPSYINYEQSSSDTPRSRLVL